MFDYPLYVCLHFFYILPNFIHFILYILPSLSSYEQRVPQKRSRLSQRAFILQGSPKVSPNKKCCPVVTGQHFLHFFVLMDSTLSNYSYDSFFYPALLRFCCVSNADTSTYKTANAADDTNNKSSCS